MSLFRILAVACLTALVLPTAAQSQSKKLYDLPLGREIRPFDQYLLESSSQRISRMTVTDPGGVQKKMQDDTALVRISANVGVEAVTEDGQEAVKNLKVRYAQLVIGTEENDLIPTGTKLKATFSDSGTVIQQSGQDLPMQVTSFLASVIRSEGGLKTGEIMNASGPIAVGEEWAVTSEALMKTLDLQMVDSTSSVEGIVRFVGIDSTGTRHVARVELNAKAINAIAQIEGAKPERSSVDMNVLIDVPVDKRYPLVYTRTRLRMMAQFGMGGGSAVIEFLTQDETRFVR